MSKSKRYWIWIDSKPGVPPHQLAEEISKHEDFTWGRSCQTWSTALAYLRDYMKAGFIVRIYEVDE